MSEVYAKMSNVLIIGKGEVGISISKLYDKDKYNIYFKDINEDPSVDGVVDTLHVCIPFTSGFKEEIIKYIYLYNPSLVIINSTVTVGTTKSIYEATNAEIVYSPVMGKHPNIAPSLLIFKKIIGGCTDSAVEMACEHFNDLNVETVIYNNPEEAEMAKLLSTTYYLHNIYFANLVNEKCKKYSLDYDNVYKTTNELYNEGYEQLNMTYVRRPVFIPPEKEGVGGHCIIENAILLTEMDEDKDFEFLLSLGKKSEKKHEDYTWLYCEVVGKKKSVSQIANENNVDVSKIKELITLYGIKVKTEE